MVTPEDVDSICQAINFWDDEWTPEATAAVEAVVERHLAPIRERVVALAEGWECAPPGQTTDHHRRWCPGCARASRVRALLQAERGEG